ncbi:phosphate uptake regulator [Staphylococcus auricularis]|nr:phosphate uptake regulator [Staphylococcus auricularis]
MAIIRHNYEGQLDELIKDLRRLGLRVYRNIDLGLQSLSIDDRNFARRAIAKDSEINELETEINEKVILLITKQQPVASDLRLMMAALKNRF